jgi:hypothetical protein
VALPPFLTPHGHWLTPASPPAPHMTAVKIKKSMRTTKFKIRCSRVSAMVLLRASPVLLFCMSLTGHVSALASLFASPSHLLCFPPPPPFFLLLAPVTVPVHPLREGCSEGGEVEDVASPWYVLLERRPSQWCHPLHFLLPLFSLLFFLSGLQRMDLDAKN